MATMLTGRGLPPGPVEAILHMFSLLRLCYVITKASNIGAILDVAVLCVLAVGTAWLDMKLRPLKKSVGLGFAVRECPEPGLLQGLLAVPTLMAAVAASTSRGTWLLLYRCSVASSMQMLALLLWRYSHSPQAEAHTRVENLQSQPRNPAPSPPLQENPLSARPSTAPLKCVGLGGEDAEISSLMQQVLSNSLIATSSNNTTSPPPPHDATSLPHSLPASRQKLTRVSNPTTAPSLTAGTPLTAADRHLPSTTATAPPLSRVGSQPRLSSTSTPQPQQHTSCPYAQLGSVACLVSAAAFTLSSAVLASSAVPPATPFADASSSSAPFTAAAQLPPALRITCAVAISLLCSIPGYAMLMGALPRSFTLGEGAIVAQGALLLAACSSSYLIAGLRLGPSHLLWSLHVAQPDPGMQVPAFVLLVPFWACALAGCCCLVRSPPDLLFFATKCTSSLVEPEILTTTAVTQEQSFSTTTSQSVQQPQHLQSHPQRSHLKQEQQQQQVSHHQHIEQTHQQQQQRQQQRQQWQKQSQHAAFVLRAIGYSAGAVCCVMILDLAAWVLRRFIAASTAPRLATLAYWACVMATVVPVMMFLSQHNRRWWARTKSAAVTTSLSEPLAVPVHHKDGKISRPEDQGINAGGSGLSEVEVSALNRNSEGHLAAGVELRTAPLSVSLCCQETSSVLQPKKENHQDFRKCKPQPAADSTEHSNCSGSKGVDFTASSNSHRSSSPPLNSTPNGQSSPLLISDVMGRRTLLPAWFHVPHIIMRKGYHLLALALFVPAFAWDVRMLQASLAIAFAALVAAEALRCCNIPLVSPALQRFMSDFADARDVGPLYITHFTLLLGMALPVWLSDRVCGAVPSNCSSMPLLLQPELQPSWAVDALENAPLAYSTEGSRTSFGSVLTHLAVAATHWAAGAVSNTGSGGCWGDGHGCSSSSGQDHNTGMQQHFVCSGLVGLCGLVALGMGDTAASCVGFLMGRRRLFHGSRKTVEGTSAAGVAMMASWVWVVWWLGLGPAVSWQRWGALAVITGGAALLEAVTQQLDNLVVPIYYVAHVALLFA